MLRGGPMNVPEARPDASLRSFESEDFHLSLVGTCAHDLLSMTNGLYAGLTERWCLEISRIGG